MGHDLALVCEATKRALVGYKQRWMGDRPTWTREDVIKALADYPELGEDVASWVDAQGGELVTWAHEPMGEDDQWPWEAEGGWTVTDIMDLIPED